MQPYVKEAFERLDYRERLVVSEYLSFCPDCFKLKPKKVKLTEMAVKLCLAPDAIENVYKKAIKKFMVRALQITRKEIPFY